MPQLISPPYAAGAISIPRTLIRWLDVNYQNGPLTRTATYITLPAFSVNINWLGYSDIVAAFNFEGPNNFSFAGGNMQPTAPIPNYVLCVMWKDTNNVTHRYAMWKGVGETIYGTIPLYTGQVIMKNFRFEIWSTDVAICGQATPINFYTSVAGQIDYRYGVDSQLVASDPVVTNFSATQTYVPTILPVTNLWSQWIASSGIANLTWAVKQSPSGVQYLNAGNAGNLTVATDSGINNNLCVTNPNTLLASRPTENMTAISIGFAVVKPISFTSGYCWFAFGTYSTNFAGSFCRVTTTATPGQLAIDGNNLGGVVMSAGQWYVICFIMDFTNEVVGGYVVALTNPIVEPSFNLISDTNASQPSVITVGANALGVITENFYLAELDIFNTSLNPMQRAAILNYYTNNYGPYPFSLPLTFPPNSTPQPNTINPTLTPNQKAGASPNFNEPSFGY